MRQGIHPDYLETTVICSCGNKFTTNSTKGGELHIELCSQCHPFYTGTQKLVDSGGRVQRFSDKFGNAAAAVVKKEAAEKEARVKVATEAAEEARKVRQERETVKTAKATEAAKAEAKKAERAAKAEAAQARLEEAEAAAASEAAPEAAAETEAAPETAPAEETAE